MNELKVTTETGRVYRIRGNEFMRVGEGEAPGQWYRNNVWTRYSSVSVPKEGEPMMLWQNGSYADPDLWMRTSDVVTIERSDDE